VDNPCISFDRCHFYFIYLFVAKALNIFCTVCNSSGVDKIPDDGRLRAKHVVRRGNKSENRCTEDGI
jgi:hypothetical protein